MQFWNGNRQLVGFMRLKALAINWPLVLRRFYEAAALLFVYKAFGAGFEFFVTAMVIFLLWRKKQ